MRRRVIVVSNGVLDAIDSFQTDHFKLKDLGKIAINQAIGPIKAVASFVAPAKAKEAIKDWGYNNATDFSNQNVGEKAVKIQGVTDRVGKAAAIAGAVVGGGALLGPALGLTGGASGLAKMAIKPKPTSSLSILKPSSLVDNPIEVPAGSNPIPGLDAIVANQGGSFVDQVKNLADAVPNNVKTAIKQKGQNLINQGINSVLSPSQKKLSDASTSASMLPKTKALKDAEKMLTTPTNSKALVMGIDFSSPWILAGVALVVVAIILVVIKHR